MLVLDQREADVPVAAGPEAVAGADGDPGLAGEQEREVERAELPVRLRDPRPREHRPLRPRDVPADAREPVDERVPPAAVDLVHLPRNSRASLSVTVEAICIGWKVP